MSEPTILVVDDEPQMVMILEYLLRGRGFSVITATNGAQALERFEAQPVDLVLLDVTMPRVGGVEVARRLRRISDVPIVFLTARSNTEHIVAGYEAGADDYVVKPFEPQVLTLRIEALLRRTVAPRAQVVELDGLSVDLDSRAVRVGDASVTLSDVEWRLLRALAERVGEVLSWRYLLSQAWDTQDHVGGRELVKVTIYRLRHRLGHPAAELVQTVRGEGYRLGAEAG
ncbi:hypothetical protein BW730_08235 [Tessaracoccus aquimaris]|uniref:DNA-binding response regulator n=1 Tax=Tessaracoccus aquimaris TaxID=1332264 RepID=A0A1Q2CN02_9ACTN|nr:response regulator transcription factor [Tessaracoccus aquimaris]AQP47484.1 hypothetical protein BW730_08235 [Tessaracoccus aquimaris]